MNYVAIVDHWRIFSTVVSILFTSNFVSSTTFHPIYPCHYSNIYNQLLKCDMCTCLSSSSSSSSASFSTSNLCSSLSPSSFLFCSTNISKNPHEEILRARLNEAELESVHQSFTQPSIISRKPSNDLQVELDHFNVKMFSNLLQIDQTCSKLNSSRLTFYRFQTNSSSSSSTHQCPLTFQSVRFLDTIIETNQFFTQNQAETLIFYNCTFHPSTLNLSATTNTLAIYYTKFLVKPFQFNSFSSLIYLTISHTSQFDLIGSFSNLIYLDLCHTQLNDQQLNRIFSQVDMPDLISLILANNQLTTLKTRFPSTIRYLDLSFNQIKSLDYISFKSLYSLNTLNLSFNTQIDIQQDTFTRVPYLEILDLTSCLPISPIDDLFLPLQKLRYLNISSNQLKSLPRLPVPYDAHTIASYDHHLPVLYVDVSKNELNQIDFEVLSSASTQDKYIISIDMTRNHLKTIQFPSSLSSGIRRRGPLIELNIHHNPLECDCILYENLFPLFQNDAIASSPSLYPPPTPFQPLSPGYFVNPYAPSGHMGPPPHGFIRTRRQYFNQVGPSASTILAQNLARKVRIKFLHLDNLTCEDSLDLTKRRSLFDLNSSNSFCSYTKHCPSSCTCCSSTSTYFYSNENCPCYDQCPLECSCKRSYDLTKNYVNCSHRDLTQLPSPLPYSTTHLNLNFNQLKSLTKNLSLVSKLESLSIAHNRLESLINDEFVQLSKIEDLDLSHNQITKISPRTFSSMFNLKHLQLHNNPWIPKFYSNTGEFQSNTRLNYLTFGLGLTCNRSMLTSSSLIIEGPLTADDCCKHSNIESCQQFVSNNENFFQSNPNTPPFYNDPSPWNSKRLLHFFVHHKYRLYILIGISALTIGLLGFMILCCVCCFRGKKKTKKHPSPAERKLLPNGDSKNDNHYHKSLQVTASTTPQISSSSSSTAIQKLIHSTRQKGSSSNGVYRDQENDASASFTDNDDEDDYASIPLTVSQADLVPVIRPQPAVPPLPPPRQIQSLQHQTSFSLRPTSNSSTTSTSTTIRSIVPTVKRTNSTASKQQQQQQQYQSSLRPARSCLQIKLDALVLYSINDSELIHGDLGLVLEEMYGKRFSFHFIHRDRMLGELDWLIENSCVIIIFLRKPYHIVHDYMKILSTSSSSVKIFLILVNDEINHQSSTSSMKAREKIAKLYRTSDIYEWNSNPRSILHEQLELFLERNCGSATYVPY